MSRLIYFYILAGRPAKKERIMYGPFCINQSGLITRFSPGLKILILGLQGGIAALGTYAMAMDSIWYGGVYLAGMALISWLAVFPHFCGYCPYPHKYGDCLIMPLAWIKRLAPYRGQNMGVKGRAAIMGFLLYSLLVPQPWLWGDWVRFGLFWLLAVGMGLVFRVRLCVKCRHLSCPANRVSQDHREQAQKELASVRVDLV
jgi:hypothetical protein